jgi:novobiocin biosynthesis protein NovU/D-mycarose 3-C-methyltransferase
MYIEHTHCRICQSNELLPVLDLGVQPLANDFRPPGHARQGMVPLKLLLCPECLLGQLSVVVDPIVLYANYAYSTSTTQTMRAHWDWLIDEFLKLTPAKKVVEIGSNDGAFLAHLKKSVPDRQVLGIDPSVQFCKSALEQGVPTIRKMWGIGAAHEALARFKPDLVVARHVFAHMNDWKGTMEALDCLCSKDTVVAIEVPNAVSMLRSNYFDQVYHEHLSYITPYSMWKLLAQTPFRCFQVLYSAVHGGSTVYFLNKHPDTHQLVYSKMGINISDWETFASDSKIKIERFHKMATNSDTPFSLVGYGAPAKSTVWIQAAKLDKTHLKCLFDCNPRKVGTLSPGTDIPVHAESEFKDVGTPRAVLFAWNYESEIKRKQADWIEAGGKFMLP